jgi:hypothetical protein
LAKPSGDGGDLGGFVGDVGVRGMVMSERVEMDEFGSRGREIRTDGTWRGL